MTHPLWRDLKRTSQRVRRTSIQAGLLLALTIGGSLPIRADEVHRAPSARTGKPAVAMTVPARASPLDINLPAVRADALENSWPQFRGPDGQGHASQTGLPLHWNEKLNVAWKTRILGDGWSSPVIADDQIWVTTALDDGKQLHAICVDRVTGKILHDVEVFRVAEPGLIHSKNSHASPTAVLSGNRVIVHFGAHGTAGLSSEGKVEWKTCLPSYHHHGPAGSPILTDGILFLACDGATGPFWDKLQRPAADMPQFVVALDPANGDVKWKHERKGRHSYSTALAIQVDGKTQIISPGGNRVTAYDPVTGADLWWVTYSGYSVVPRPVYGNNLLYVCTGYDGATLLAIRPTGRGDVTQTHVAWNSSRGIPHTTSPVLVDKELYFVNDAGIARCLNALTGETHWQNRLGGNFSASPIAANGRIYFVNENGRTTVVEQSTTFKRLATNLVDGRTFASPAVAGRSIYLRSDKFLYRLHDQPER